MLHDAASKKIVEGYGDGNFGVNDDITREQLVTILYRYAQYKGYDVSVGENTNILSCDDSFSISEYAYPALQWACGAGIISGDDGSLLPQNNATRSQVAVILRRFIGNIKGGGGGVFYATKHSYLPWDVTVIQ